VLNNNAKLNFRLGDIIQAGLGVAMVDGGFVIAVQIVNFLLVYFGARFPADADSIQALAGLNKASFFIAILTTLNLAVIIYRITGLSRGMKYNAVVCYQQALRRGPALIMLYLLGSALMLILAIPLLRITQNQNLIMFLMLSLIPIGMLACIYVIDQEKNPLQAIIETFKTVSNKLSVNLLLNLALLYSLPFSLGTMFTAPAFMAPYTSLLNAVWFLFCHILTIVVYAGTCVKLDINTSDKKPTKVIIV
jgi:hypothetical protein